MKIPVTKAGVPVAPRNTRIDLKLAQTRVKQWLMVMSQLPIFKDKPKEIPRAIYISIEDIKELEKDCKKYHGDELMGIRIYFGLSGEIEPMPHTVFDIRGLVVPVLKAVNRPGGKDAIYRNPADSDPEKTDVYDFTTPCPAYCDFDSELYVS